MRLEREELCDLMTEQIEVTSAKATRRFRGAK